MPFDFDLPHAGGEVHNGAGVQPWSSPEQYVIFSIDPDPAVTDRFGVNVHFLNWLKGEPLTGQAFAPIGHKQLVGCYKGQREPAWVINARDWRKLAASGWIDGQESILHLGPFEGGSRTATLYFSKPRHAGTIRDIQYEQHWVQIGEFRQETKAYALKQEAWTLDPTTGEYFVAD